MRCDILTLSLPSLSLPSFPVRELSIARTLTKCRLTRTANIGFAADADPKNDNKSCGNG